VSTPFELCFEPETDFGDVRLGKRIQKMFNTMAANPGGTLPKKLEKTADLMGCYRFLNNKKVSHQAMIQSHRDHTIAQLASTPRRILLVHDDTVLDFSDLDIYGLGQVGDGNGRGLYAHNSLAVEPGSRQPLGLWGQILHSRARAPKKEKRDDRRNRPSRESRLWKDGVKDLPALAPGIQVVDVSDRGSDIAEYIDFEVSSGRQFIVRSMHNRTILPEEDGGIGKLHDLLESLQSMGSYTLHVQATQTRQARQAKMLVTWRAVQVVPPRQARGDHGTQPIPLFAVMAVEADAPSKTDQIKWVLLTNLPVASLAEARGIIDDYACRWVIEDYHKAMKSCCGVENLQMTTLEGLSNAIGVLSVLAVHVLRLRWLARDPETAQEPASRHAEPLLVRVAAAYIKKPDWKAMTVWEFYIAVARMGGYVANPKKRPPGIVILCRGYIRLHERAEGARMMQTEMC